MSKQDRVRAACKMHLFPPALRAKQARKALGDVPQAARQTLLESVRFPNHACSCPRTAAAAVGMCPSLQRECTRPVRPHETHTCLVSCWRWATWERLGKRKLLAAHARLRFLLLLLLLFLILFSLGVCHNSQGAQANVGVSAERQPTASCADHLQSGIIPLYSISLLYFSFYFFMGACPAVSGEPYSLFWMPLAPSMPWLQAGGGVGWVCTGRWVHRGGRVLRVLSQPPSSGCCQQGHKGAADAC